MSRFTVRVTAALAILAVLCLSLPASAATGSRVRAPQAPIGLGSGVLDHFLSWIGSLVLGTDAPAPAGRTGKGIGITLPGTSGEMSTSPDHVDRGGMIDPNGGS